MIPESFTGQVTFTIALSGTDDVRFELAAGGVIALTPVTPTLWTCQLSADQVLFGYAPNDANHNFVGRVAVRENGNVLLRLGTWALISDAQIAPISTWSPASDMLASDHVVNIHDGSAAFITVPRLRSIAMRFHEVFPDEYDFLNLVFIAPSIQENRFHARAKNEVQGIGLNPFDSSALWGSAGRFMGVNAFPIPAFFDGAETGMLHEIGHQWMNHLNLPPLAPGPHWPAGTQARGIISGFGSGQGLNFPYTLVAQTNGDYRMQSASLLRDYTDLDLYLMGLIGPDDVGPNFVFSNPNQAICNGCSGPVTFFTSMTSSTSLELAYRTSQPRKRISGWRP
ncbi:MAG: hypothetical protein ACI8QZ_003264 [Chlamydiales bacterium]|jgi:hypothetical protein